AACGSKSDNKDNADGGAGMTGTAGAGTAGAGTAGAGTAGAGTAGAGTAGAGTAGAGTAGAGTAGAGTARAGTAGAGAARAGAGTAGAGTAGAGTAGSGPGTPGWTVVPLIDDTLDPANTIQRTGDDFVSGIYFASLDDGWVVTREGRQGSDGGAVFKANHNTV